MEHKNFILHKHARKFRVFIGDTLVQNTRSEITDTL